MSQTGGFDTLDDMLLDTEAVDKEKRKARSKRRTAICLAVTVTFAAGVLTWAGITSFWNPKLPEDFDPQITCQDPTGDPTAPNIFCTIISEDPELVAYNSELMSSNGDTVLTAPKKDVSIHDKHCAGQGHIQKSGSAPTGINGSATMLETIQTVLTDCEADPDWVLHVDHSAEEQELESMHYHIRKHHASHDPDVPTAIFHEDPTTGKPKPGSYALNQAAIKSMDKSDRKEMKEVCEYPIDGMSMTIAECLESLGIKVKTVPQLDGDGDGTPP